MRKHYTFIIFFLLITSFLYSKNKADLIVNGDFSAGNTGFFTDYKYSPGNMKPATCYSITKNAKKEYFKFDSCKDHTSGDGNYMLINGSDTSDKVIWGQTIKNLDKYQTYELSLWLMSIDTLNTGILYIYINDIPLKGMPIYLEKDKCNWTNYKYYWNSLNSDSARITLISGFLRYYGNDYGIDDITFKSECEVIADAGNDKKICIGESVNIGGNSYGNYPPLNYSWIPTDDLDNPTSQNPNASPDSTTEYILYVSDNIGCIAKDTVKVTVNPPPQGKITTDKNPVICPCENINLTAPDADTYRWSDGQTQKTIQINKPGKYSVTAYSGNACFSISEIDISLSINSLTFGIDEISAKTGDMVSLPFKLKSDNQNNNCGDYLFNLNLSYNPTIITPVFSNYPKVMTDDNEEIIFNGISLDKLKNLKFFVTLGNDSCTYLNFNYANFSCPDLKLKTENSKLCISNLCTEPNNRFYQNNTGKIKLSIYHVPNNTAVNFNLEVIENTSYRVFITDVKGIEIEILANSFLKSGKYGYNLKTNTLAPGVYFFNVLCRDGIKTEKFFITN